MIESGSPDTDGSALLRTLSQWRRRRRTVAIAAQTLTAVMVLSGIAVPLLLSPARSLIRQHELWLAAIAVAAVLIAIVHAAVRTPTIREMAGLVDHRLGLSDGLITAVECAGSSDPIERLVVRGVLRDAAGQSSARLFPFRPPERRAVLATIALAMIVGIMSVTVIPQPSEFAQRGSSATRGAESESLDGGGARPANRNDAAESTSSRAHAGDRDPPTALKPQASPSAASGTVSVPVTAAERHPEQAERSFARRDSNSTSVSGGRDIGSRPGRGGMPSTAGVPSTLPGEGLQSSSNRGGLAGGGSTSASAAGEAVSSGPVLAQRPTRTQGDFSAGGTDDEAAVTNDRIPPGLARYVKAYFAAIQAR